MARLKGGELLIDLTSIGNISNGDTKTLPENIVKSIHELCGYDENRFVFTKFDKPILLKIIIDDYLSFVYINKISDDFAIISGSTTNDTILYELRIQENSISCVSYQLSIQE